MSAFGAIDIDLAKRVFKMDILARKHQRIYARKEGKDMREVANLITLCGAGFTAMKMSLVAMDAVHRGVGYIPEIKTACCFLAAMGIAFTAKSLATLYEKQQLHRVNEHFTPCIHETRNQLRKALRAPSLV